jgi:hypothetical protein
MPDRDQDSATLSVGQSSNIGRPSAAAGNEKRREAGTVDDRLEYATSGGIGRVRKGGKERREGTADLRKHVGYLLVCPPPTERQSR